MYIPPQLPQQTVHATTGNPNNNSINYNNNQNHYQRQQQSFDHYSPLLIADDQQKPNQFDNIATNPHQTQHHSMNGKNILSFCKKKSQY